ncbi:hypothetical protein FZD47_01340 [Bacillus infantis]|uniref:Uncharacterized protein n=1 Tax=Bacillus infantis TaxID=324767 RepID=A0A5D4SS22_9BACI|nr:hypothetical protein FZD47_01340 [Bacillus infantis]
MIGVQGTKTPAGNSGRAETPQELAPRRLSAAPRKAKCLERKSTASYLSATKNLFNTIGLQSKKSVISGFFCLLFLTVPNR